MNEPLPRCAPSTVTTQDVLWCYRQLLGREPESDAAVASHLGHRDFRALVECFVECEEYRLDRRADPAAEAGAAPRLHALALPGLDIEVDASEQQLARAWDKVQATWAHLGREKPHYSVVTDKRFLPQSFGEHGESFWMSGEQEAEVAQRMRQRHDRRDASSLTCVEYGCGVGRVTMALARRFARVVAYDISPAHLGLARDRCASVKVDNVHFVDGGNSVVADLARCDFFYSRIVFQHNPPPLIAVLVDAALRALKPRGIAIFQLPVYAHGYGFDLEKWLAHEAALDMEMHVLPQEHVFARVATAGCELLEVREDNATGAP